MLLSHPVALETSAIGKSITGDGVSWVERNRRRSQY
jgi:hypothetical protein